MRPVLEQRAAAAADAIEHAHPGLPGSWCERVAELRALSGQAVTAARLLVTVGRRAVEQGAVNSGLAAMRQASDLLTAPTAESACLQLEIDEVRVDALCLAGDYRQLTPLAADLAARLRAAGADPRREARVLLRAATTRPENDLDAAAAHAAAAAAIAARLQDTELGARSETVTARIALTTGELDQAEAAARRALATAESAGLTGGWPAEVAQEALQIIGRRERLRDIGAAEEAFERARKIADELDLGIWRIRSRHELATNELLRTGSAVRLRQVRSLAQQAGTVCVGTVIDFQLGNLRSLGDDLDEALEIARQCQRSAARIKAPQTEALAFCLEGSIAAIRGDREAAELGAERAEATLPDDPELLMNTWGQVRVLAALLHDDLAGALRADEKAAGFRRQALELARCGRGLYSAGAAPILAPKRSLTLHALLAAITDGDADAAVAQAIEMGAASSWNAGCLAYAEAVIEGRHGHADHATALAEEGSEQFASFAPLWNHLVRRYIAEAALRDGWGDPRAWLRDAAREFESESHDELASACRGLLRRAGGRVPRCGRGTAKVPAGLRRLGITSREMDVYLLVGKGLSNPVIAQELYISPKTVETHIASLIAKTGRSGRRELVAFAARSAA
jgi:DNA-binding CsgD family transcriptional regulator